MALGYFKVVFVGAAGVAGTAGTIYVGSKAMDFSSVVEDNDEIIHTVKDKLKDRLISRSNFKDGWSSRFEKLKLDKSPDLHSGLRKLQDKKDPVATGDDLKRWCSDSSIEPYEESSSLVKGMEKYCTYLIRDQVNGLITDKGEEAWKDAKEKLKNMDDSKLSEEMKKVKSEENLESWCLEKYENPFKDKKDPIYSDVSKFCKKVIKRPESSKTQEDSVSPPSR